MTNPTSNFGWQMPTASDLVTDLPADFETFGQAVDTSLADLKGGTTGQVLAKASATDMDFSWVTTDDANAIQNAIVDAKGDLISATANDTPARLAVGANGDTLVADSSTSTGLRYTAGNALGNPVLNSAMQNWQRGTSVSIAANTGGYSADRWYLQNGVNQAVTITRQATADTTNLPFIQYCARVQRNSGQTGTGGINFGQSFETFNSRAFAGKTVTISFYARAGANYSATSSALGFGISTGTGTDQNYPGYTGYAGAAGGTATLTTTWQRFSTSGAIGATVTEIAPIFTFTPTGTASTNDYYEITGVQIDIGSVALPFRTYAGTIQGELAACQRYYQRITPSGQFSSIGSGIVTSTTGAVMNIALRTSMRITPTAVDYSNLGVSDATGTYPITSMSLSTSSSPDYVKLNPVVASGLVQYRPADFVGTTASHFIGFTSEL
jgi:hypothetical protein